MAYLLGILPALTLPLVWTGWKMGLSDQVLIAVGALWLFSTVGIGMASL
jgi:hypothetical protein